MATSSTSYDWQVGKSLSECFDHVFTSGIASDVTFVVGEERKRVAAHKLVLISRSPVFYAMFEGPMAEKGEITIPDISYEAFELFLRYLYTDNIDLTSNNVIPVLNAARKYCVDVLVSHCGKFLASDLSTENVCDLLEQAHVFEMDGLKSDCLKFIYDHSTTVLQSAAFRDLSLSCVTSITESDDLPEPENIVYEAIIRWAEAECVRQSLELTDKNKRDVLGKTLYTVRYIYVDEEFLVGKVCSDMVLKSDDIVELINHRKNKKAIASVYLDTKRRPITTPVRVYRNGQVCNALWLDVPEDDGISFKSSTDVYLHGFGSFHTANEPSSVDLKVFEGNNCLVNSTKTLAASDSPNMGNVVFDQPIKIHAGKLYTIIERSNKPKFFYFEDGETKVKFNDVTIEFSDTPKSRCTNTNRGHIPYLLLSYIVTNS